MGKNIPKASKDDAQRPKRQLAKKVLWCCWIAYGALAAGATLWIAVTPRVFVYPSVALDPANPMFTMFVVRNEGYLAIRDVKFECSIDSLTLPDGTQVKAEVPYDNRFFDPNQVARVIDPGEEWSALLPFSGMKDNRFEKADIAVRLLFRPFRFWPFSLYVHKELHRFETRQGKDGQWHWFPQPINK
jgi:hypothetical protein